MAKPNLMRPYKNVDVVGRPHALDGVITGYLEAEAEKELSSS
jgi:hypothetical protein